MWGSNHNCHHHQQGHHPSHGGYPPPCYPPAAGCPPPAPYGSSGYPHGYPHHSGHGSGVVGMLAAAASYGAHRIAHGHGHSHGYAHGHGGYYRHKHGKFKHAREIRKTWKIQVQEVEVTLLAAITKLLSRLLLNKLFSTQFSYFSDCNLAVQPWFLSISH
ncbi:hypothetical protein ACET3Z_001905 [Daucus carota]